MAPPIWFQEDREKRENGANKESNITSFAFV